MANSLFQTLWPWSKLMIESEPEDEPLPELVPTFKFTGASVIGSGHSLAGQTLAYNNQDTWLVEDLGGGRLVGVVCDGCTSCPHSEVGAYLGSRFLVDSLVEELEGDEWIPDKGPDWDSIRDRLVDRLWMAVGGRRWAKESMLFTIVGFVITPRWTWIFNFGDGVFEANGERHVIKPPPPTEPSGPENAPAYLMYLKLGSRVLEDNPELRHFQVRRYDTRTVSTLLIGSDGVTDLVEAAEKNLPGKKKPVGPISQIFEIPVFMNNPDKLRRWLALASLEYVQDGQIKLGLLPDDTTIVAVKVEWPEGARSADTHESSAGTVVPADGTVRGSITTPLPPEPPSN